MKAPIKYLLALAISTSLSAQERPVRRVAQATKTSPAVILAPNAKRATAKKTLSENITLKLSGDFQGFVELDLQLTGTGPSFQTDLITETSEEGMPPTIIHFQANVAPEGDDYQVEYSLGARIVMNASAKPTGSNRISPNFEYRDIVLTGSVRLVSNEGVVLSKLNGKELTLTAGPAK